MHVKSSTNDMWLTINTADKKRYRKLAEVEQDSPRDILDLLTLVKQAAVKGIDPEQAGAQIMDLTNFLRQFDPTQIKSPRIGAQGRLDLVGAMRESASGVSLWDRLAALDLKATSKEDFQRMGAILAS